MGYMYYIALYDARKRPISVPFSTLTRRRYVLSSLFMPYEGEKGWGMLGILEYDIYRQKLKLNYTGRAYYQPADAIARYDVRAMLTLGTPVFYEGRPYYDIDFTLVNLTERKAYGLDLTDRNERNAMIAHGLALKQDWGGLLDKAIAKYGDTVNALRYAGVWAWLRDEKFREKLKYYNPDKPMPLVKAVRDLGLAYSPEATPKPVSDSLRYLYVKHKIMVSR